MENRTNRDLPKIYEELVESIVGIDLCYIERFNNKGISLTLNDEPYYIEILSRKKDRGTTLVEWSLQREYEEENESGYKDEEDAGLFYWKNTKEKE